MREQYWKKIILKELLRKNHKYKDVDLFESLRDKMLPRDEMPPCACLYEDAPLCTLFTDARYVLCLYSASLSIKMRALMRRDLSANSHHLSDPYFDCCICNNNRRERCKRLTMDDFRNDLPSYNTSNRRVTIKAMIVEKFNRISVI